MNRKLLTFLVLLVWLGLLSSPAVSETDGKIDAGELVLTGTDFASGSGEGILVTADGLTLAATEVTGFYISPVLAAPLRYNAVLPQWSAGLSGAASVTIQVRTGKDDRWSEWYELHENHDWMSEENASSLVGDLITVPAADVTHTTFQFAVHLNHFSTDPAPVLHQLRLTFINSTRGPTADELVARQEALNVAQGRPQAEEGAYAKPFVVSRQAWCTDPACNYTEGLSYHPVTHLVLHHTVTSNNSPDWAATVRAIWYGHTFVQGWGDIGYQYLVDMNGVLYEGRLGGDDVIGTHATVANRGSMALALLGTFTRPEQNPPGIAPPAPMLNAAAELFAWKAAQKNIDVYDASRMPNTAWGLPHLMGHRDVRGTTACPGDQAHVLLPWLRDEVARRTGFRSPYIYVDELSDAFSRGGGNWRTASSGCGFNGHAYYTWSTTDPNQATTWGEWRPVIEASGRYEVSVYAPYCITGRAETGGATYTIEHAHGASTAVVSHEANVGTWMVLGQFDFLAGGNNSIRLTNLTQTDSDLGVWFDAIRLRPVAVTVSAANQQPAHENWLGQRAVTFKWQTESTSLIATTTLEVASDPTFTNKVLSVNVPAATTSYTHTFAVDHADLYWRVILVSTWGTVVSSQPTRFGIDTIPPASQVHAIYRLANDTFIVTWQGSDNSSGVAGYNVSYRADSASSWTPWLNESPDTSAIFGPPDGQVYWFRSQAIDAAGNVEPATSGPGDLNTNQAIFLPHAIMLPAIYR